MKSDYSFSENLHKRCSGVLISAFAMCFCVILLTFILAGCNKGGSGDNTTTTQATTVSTIDEINEDDYIFSEGIYIGSASVGNKTYREAREAANKELDTLIKDFEITVAIGKEKHVFTRADFSFDNNIEEVLREAKNYNDQTDKASKDNSKIFDLTFEANRDSVAAKVAALAEATDTEAVDATISGVKNGKATITKAKNGTKLNQEKLTDELISTINTLAKGDKASAEITAEVESIEPSVSQSELNKKITLLSSFTTVSTNTANGNHNMQLALDACNGSVIMPGEVWSFNACTGNSNLTSLGYRPATVIIGGELVDGIGGGLCQSSTTIYNAAIRTNMEIVERYCHYFQSTYAAAGLDATIDYPNLDLKLKNPTDYPMYMQCYMEGTTLYCNIFGYQDPSFDKVVIDSYVDYANPDENYYHAVASRTFYKDGKVVLKEQLPSSTYHYKSPSDETSESATVAPTKPVKPTQSPKPTEPKPTTPAPTTPKPTTPTTQAPAPSTPTPTTPPTEAKPSTTPTQPVEY